MQHACQNASNETKKTGYVILRELEQLKASGGCFIRPTLCPFLFSCR